MDAENVPIIRTSRLTIGNNTENEFFSNSSLSSPLLSLAARRHIIEKERRAREESLHVIKECISQDFPNLEQAITKEVSERENADSTIAASLEQSLLELSKTAERMTDERED